MSLWDLVDKKEEPQKEVKEETPKVAEATPVAKEEKSKTTKAAKTTAKKEAKKEEAIASWEYPFGLFTEGQIVDISNYGFEEGKKYTDKEITNIMLKHRHYQFSGTMEYSMVEEDNVLVANAKQHKKG